MFFTAFPRPGCTHLFWIRICQTNLLCLCYLSQQDSSSCPAYKAIPNLVKSPPPPPHHHTLTSTQLCFPFKYHVPLKYLGNRKCVSCLPWVRSCCNLLLQYHLPITDFSSALSVYSLSHLKAPIASFDLMLSTMIISEG